MGSTYPSPELLDEIAVRFILSLPASELESFDRLLFSVEAAWWHYEDVVRRRPENAHLRSFVLREFARAIFEAVPGLEPFRASLDQIYESFNAYKRTVPVRGCIMLDPTLEKCLLVRGFKRDAGWGFPRGKLSLNESDAACAAREVLEETGFDCGPLVREADVVDAQIADQDTRLFIVAGVPESTPFAPQSHGEIGAYAWHRVAELPATWEESKQLYVNEGGGRHKFFNVWPYIKPLRKWIKAARRAGGAGAAARAAPAAAPGAAAAVAPPRAPPPPPAPPAGLAGFRFDREAIMRQVDQKLQVAAV